MSLKELTKSIKLNEEGKNAKAWLFKLTSLIQAQDLEGSFEFFYDKEVHEHVSGAPETKEKVSVLTHPEHRSTFLCLSDEEQWTAIGKRSDAQRKKDTKAHAWITVTSHDSFSSLCSSAIRHPTAALCEALEETMPTGKLAVNSDYQLTFKADVKDHGDDFSKLANALKTANKKLRSQGLELGDDALRTALVCALRGRKWKYIRTTVSTDSSLTTYNKLVASINNLIRLNKKTDKAPKPIADLQDKAMSKREVTLDGECIRVSTVNEPS